jgi:hypothetical protein
MLQRVPKIGENLLKMTNFREFWVVDNPAEPVYESCGKVTKIKDNMCYYQKPDNTETAFVIELQDHENGGLRLNQCFKIDN